MDNLKSKEVIDGVTVVHTGFIQRVLSHESSGSELEEIVEMYDSNGNRFYSNFGSIEEANKAIVKLAEEGIAAVIGPKAPWRDNDGKMIPNSSENEVGVFIVSVPEKSDDFSSHKTR